MTAPGWASGPRLVPAEAAAALLVTADGRYLLQHRDPLPHIFFPGFWGLFGGALEVGEAPEEALRRELLEELAIRPAEVRHFASLGLDFGFAGHGVLPRHVFEVPILPDDVDAMRLGEGQGMALWTGADVMAAANVIPYDATVIWQHMARGRF